MKIAGHMDSVPDIIHKIKRFKKEIEQMDLKVRRFISDRTQYPRPFPEDLVDRIRSFENQMHRYLKGFRNTEIELWLDNLMYSLLVNDRIWKRLLEDNTDDPKRKEVQKGSQKQSSVAPIIEKAYEFSIRQWRQRGISDTESRQDFSRRIVSQYQNARKNIGPDEKIALSYHLNDHSVHIKIKKRS